MSLINKFCTFFFFLVDNMAKMIKLNYLGQSKEVEIARKLQLKNKTRQLFTT